MAPIHRIDQKHSAHTKWTSQLVVYNMCRSKHISSHSSTIFFLNSAPCFHYIFLLNFKSDPIFAQAGYKLCCRGGLYVVPR